MSPITPPVQLPEEVSVPEPVAADLTALQRLAASDKSAVVAAVLHAAVLLDAALGLHLSASQVAILGTIVSAGVSYFLTVRINARKP